MIAALDFADSSRSKLRGSDIKTANFILINRCCVNAMLLRMENNSTEWSIGIVAPVFFSPAGEYQCLTGF